MDVRFPLLKCAVPTYDPNPLNTNQRKLCSLTNVRSKTHETNGNMYEAKLIIALVPRVISPGSGPASAI
ncbi:hypothetical protein N7461_000235 [Penicillium sp. DV-2018c]|nr:hypothetical protein N7461_000235 [Penicillium sp. DV-2018c]